LSEIEVAKKGKFENKLEQKTNPGSSNQASNNNETFERLKSAAFPNRPRRNANRRFFILLALWIVALIAALYFISYK
jgi:hypothetical protein